MAGIEINPQSKSTEEKNLQSTRLEGENLRIDHDALRDVFCRPELQGKKFAVISIAGKTRSGKSFLMNFVLRYLRRRGWENNDWMGDEDNAIEKDGLPFAGGAERCTTGIRVFKVPIGDETMMVMLMDTQGLFDNDTPEVVNKSLLTLTTLMSSVQIFNSNIIIDSQSMEYLKTCVDFALRTAKATAKQGVNSVGYMKLQNLMFLVRDFPENDDGSFGLESGNKYLHDILSSNRGGDELVRIRTRIKESFDNVEGFVMPHPGLEATKKKFKARNKDVEDLFRVYVQHFVEHIMNPRNLVPKRSSTKAVTPREMLNMIAACDKVFANGIIDAQNMMKMNEKTYFSSMCQEAIMEYDNLMKDIQYKDGDELQKKHDESKVTAIQKLKEAEFVGNDDTSSWKEHYLKHFSTQCDSHFDNTMREYEIQKEKRELEVARILLQYESRMKSGMLNPLSDDKFEELHEKIKQAVCDTCDDSEVLKTIFDRMIKVYERIKEENKRNREKAEKKKKLILQLLKKSQKEWAKFLKILPDDAQMLKKKEEIFSKIFSKYFEETGMDQSSAQEELLEDLTRDYEHAKRQSELQWNLAAQKMNNEADELILKDKQAFSKQMMDCYISEEAIKERFTQLMEKDFEAVTGTKLESERAKQYFKEIMKKKCDEATKEVLMQNSRNKKSNDIETNSVSHSRPRSEFDMLESTIAAARLGAALILSPEITIPALLWNSFR